MTGTQARVDGIRWYHEFDFSNGVRARSSTENLTGVREVWGFIEHQLDRVPCEGRSILDVGAWDGYWSFFAERRHARSVLATDDATQRWANEGGILLARELLGSTIDVREDVPVYELTSLGLSFDVILCLGVHYHLWDPLRALVEIRHCCHPETIVIIEGELAWAGMTDYEARFRQSSWQECILAAPLLEHILRLAYFRVDEQVWMHPVPAGMAPSAQVKVDRSMLVCRPFEGTNSAYVYRPHFGLDRFDDRFGPDTADRTRRATLRLVHLPETVAPGVEFEAVVHATNTGDGRWRRLRLLDSQGPMLSGHSAYHRQVGLDFASAFLDKRIVPGEYGNIDPVARYRAYIEANWLQGSTTVGVQLWDDAGHVQIDQDYSRGFLTADVPAGGSAVASVRMRAPMTPGRYTLRFDMVCEYVCWFAAEGSLPLTAALAVTRA